MPRITKKTLRRDAAVGAAATASASYFLTTLVPRGRFNEIVVPILAGAVVGAATLPFDRRTPASAALLTSATIGIVGHRLGRFADRRLSSTEVLNPDGSVLAVTTPPRSMKGAITAALTAPFVLRVSHEVDCLLGLEACDNFQRLFPRR